MERQPISGVHPCQVFGRALVIEYNGDVFARDDCVYPQHRLGNIINDSISQVSARHDATIGKQLSRILCHGCCEGTVGDQA
jgi:radical SAM protein with 4Fe4S-binding SPASM domain